MTLIAFKHDTLIDDDPASLKSRVPCAEEEIRIQGAYSLMDFFLDLTLN